MCNRRVMEGSVSSAHEGGWCVKVRAATSVRRVGVKRRCALGLPRVVDGGEGDRVHIAACGRRVLLVAARNLAVS
jgi:hypothetical protein